MAEIVLDGLFDKNNAGVNLYTSFGRIILLIIDILVLLRIGSYDIFHVCCRSTYMFNGFVLWESTVKRGHMPGFLSSCQSL